MTQNELMRRDEFEDRLSRGDLRLSLVGMSNVGKSYRAKILSKEMSFYWYDVDAEIQKALGFTTMEEISEWMGYPTSNGYAEREQRYLALENEITAKTSPETNGKNLILDTTGSVVHLPSQTLQKLRNTTLVVHIEAGEERVADMVEKFFREPKPVTWCEFFFQQPGESVEESLRHSYPALLKERFKKYRELGHIHIPAEEVFNASGREFLAAVANRLT